MEDLILVTGGAGFIGSNFILQWIASEPARILNLDKLTYAGNLNNLRAVQSHPRYCFGQGDIVDRTQEVLARTDIPIVFFDSRLDEATTFVGTDNSQSISLIVEYLCRTGERPSFFEMPHVNCNAIERRAAYLQTMARLGLQPELISPGSQQSWNFEEIGYTEALRLIDSSGFPTRTVLCANDRMAFGVMAAAYQRRLKIGREDDCNLRIAGHDDHPLSRYACPPLTTVAQDYDRLGTLCTETLLAKISDDTEAGKRTDLVGSIRLEGKLVMRSSA